MRVISSNLTRFGCVKFDSRFFDFIKFYFDSYFFIFIKFYIDSSSNLNAGKFEIKVDKIK